MGNYSSSSGKTTKDVSLFTMEEGKGNSTKDQVIVDISSKKRSNSESDSDIEINNSLKRRKTKRQNKILSDEDKSVRSNYWYHNTKEGKAALNDLDNIFFY
ncbi:hypothetical protein CPAV1605_559 [seawater metagenome]|uniref:Uncharacterized protein n=1 Tax=seawater metagenome TaxID=1561972 RepID=A0A5E8CJM5_9ZZZZ